MSTLEKKALAFEKLASIHNENSIDEILLYLDKKKEDEAVFDTDSFFKKASEKYDDVLKKLAN
jgi:hypothetical protein